MADITYTYQKATFSVKKGEHEYATYIFPSTTSTVYTGNGEETLQDLLERGSEGLSAEVREE